MKISYRQRLPHLQPVGACFFITFRLHGSIPFAHIKKLQDEYHQELQKFKRSDLDQKLFLENAIRKSYFTQYDDLLHDLKCGPVWLVQDEIARIIWNEIHRWDGKLYELLCLVIMSNHIHLVIDTAIQLGKEGVIFDPDGNYLQLHQILKRIKGASAVMANRQLNRSGQFWQRESWDVIVRNEKMLRNVIFYSLNNPVKARIVKDWEEYEWSYLKGHGSCFK